MFCIKLPRLDIIMKMPIADLAYFATDKQLIAHQIQKAECILDGRKFTQPFTQLTHHVK